MNLLWNYLKNYKKLLGLALLLATINQIFSLLDPLFFRHIIDDYASKVGEIPPDKFLRGVTLLLLASMGTTFVSRVAKNFQDYYVNATTFRLGAKMYNHSVAHSFSLPFKVFEDQRSGELLEKLRNARQDAMKLVTQTINVLFLSMVGIVFVIIYAFITHWAVGLFYLAIIPAMGTGTYLISRKIKQAQSAIIKETSALSGSTTETLRNVELVKSLGLETQEIKRLNNVVEQILKLELVKVKLVRKYSFLQGTMVNALRSGLLLLMLYLMMIKAISLGEFFSLMFYSFAIFQPLGEFGNLVATYQEASASMKQLDDILKIEKEEKPANPEPLEKIKEVGFENVTFAYASSDQNALTNLNLQIENGATIAFVGPSGSGKTSIIKLLVGLYDPNQGTIRYNGIDLKNLDKEKMRAKIGFVSQDTQLFAGTIRDNLLFVRPDATDEDCLNALKSASAKTIIERGDKGLDTKIGEGGLKLSGGEKQRLSIARALLRQPDLIIFDEATSSLDSLTEKEITETIKQIKESHPDLLTVLVAHRLSTIVHADKIYVLEKGSLAEQGTHQELLDKKGLYSALWRQQIAVRE